MFSNVSNVSFYGKNPYKQKLKDIVDEDKLDAYLN